MTLYARMHALARITREGARGWVLDQPASRLHAYVMRPQLLSFTVLDIVALLPVNQQVVRVDAGTRGLRGTFTDSR